MISQTAQGLASLGRNGDTMLVHMSPEEVGGLKQVGDSLGIRMSTNPHTGMPEAFSFGDFFTSFLPTIVGAAVGGPGGAGIMSQMTPILAGAGTGALLAAAKGDDPLMGGLTGGLGGYGGSQLGQSFGKMFSNAGGTTASSMDDLITAGTKNLTGQGAGAQSAMGFSQAGQAPIGFQAPGQGGLSLQTAAPDAIKSVTSAPISPTAQMAENLSNVGSGIKNLTGFGDMSISDAYAKFTSPAVGGSASQLAMPIGSAVLAGLEPSDLGYGTGNLYEDPDKGKYRGPQGQLNLSDRFDTGLRLATGGTIQSGGIRDLYGTPDNQPTISPGLSGFGLGRLNNLAGEQAMTQAQTLGYEDGGSVTSGDSSVSSDAPGSDLPSDAYMSDIQRSLMGRSPVHYTGASSSPGFSSSSPYGSDMIGEMLRVSPEVFRYDYGMGRGTMLPGGFMPRREYGMAKGGYLNGDGDGMSDSIPATIEGKQPARLADGEFVIPADVVSHLGNGSSKAGSKRLYAMLDKVRQARTGTKKQGKEINPAKYMPA